MWQPEHPSSHTVAKFGPGLLIFTSHQHQIRQELSTLRTFRQRMTFLAEGACWADLYTFTAACATLRLAPKLRQVGNNHTTGATTHHIPRMSAFDLGTDSNTSRTKNAPVVVDYK